ncbi:hypothetical protein LXL04_004505 [Taraxacum kok-saghyz]
MFDLLHLQPTNRAHNRSNLHTSTRKITPSRKDMLPESPHKDVNLPRDDRASPCNNTSKRKHFIIDPPKNTVHYLQRYVWLVEFPVTFLGDGGMKEQKTATLRVYSQRLCVVVRGRTTHLRQTKEGKQRTASDMARVVRGAGRRQNNGAGRRRLGRRRLAMVAPAAGGRRQERSLAGRKRRQEVEGGGCAQRGKWENRPGRVKEEFRQYYCSLFSKQRGVRPVTSSDIFSSISDDQRDFLQRAFTREEFKRVVWDCGSDKALGPDGFSFGFIKKYWEVLAEDVFKFVEFFHARPFIPKGCNVLFFTMISKIRDSKHVKDFLRTSLIGCQYKIIGNL